MHQPNNGPVLTSVYNLYNFVLTSMSINGCSAFMVLWAGIEHGLMQSEGNVLMSQEKHSDTRMLKAQMLCYGP